MARDRTYPVQSSPPIEKRDLSGLPALSLVVGECLADDAGPGPFQMAFFSLSRLFFGWLFRAFAVVVNPRQFLRVH